MRLESRGAYLFILPAFIFLALFFALPGIIAFILSFTEYNILNPPKFIGIKNYLTIFKDEVFLKALINTSYFSLLYISGKFILSFLIALALTKPQIRFKRFFLTCYYIPVITSVAAASMIWLWLYEPNVGIFNNILSFLHLPTSKWIYSSRAVIPSITFMTIWKDFGYSVILFIAGLSSIPKEIFEAATVDGAKGWILVRKITIPLLKPTILFVLVTSVIGSFQIFTAIYIMTQGGPANASTTVVHQIYLNAFAYLKMGKACAMAFILFIIILFFSLVQFKLVKESEEYY